MIHLSWVHDSPYLQLDVVSQVEDETLKVAPYLLVELTGIEPIPPTVDQVYVIPAPCGGGRPDLFEITLSPDRDKVFAAPQALRRDMLGKDGRWEEGGPFTYFTLEPGEREVFTAFVRPQVGYYHHFRVGIQYSYRGQEDVYWSDKEFIVGLAAERRRWVARDSILSELKSSSGADRSDVEKDVEEFWERTLDKHSAESIVEQIASEEQAIRNYETSFKLP